MPIQFFNEETPFTLLNPSFYTDWLQQVIDQEKKQLGDLNIIFCSDDYLLGLNQSHLQHDYYTDVITFNNSDQESLIEADIFISVDRVRENADAENVDFEYELSRVMVHGLLHLIGFNDKSHDEQMVMRQKEDACLSLQKI